ncbi:MAG: ABC transporter ATP-binding protein [Bacteroidales bacterium]
MQAIETSRLTKFYGKDRGIEDLDLSVAEGEIFGFIGPNGAGKSTTIRLLLSLIFPTRGSGRVFGLDMIAKAPEIKKMIGFVPSEVSYYQGMTVKELLRYSAGFYGAELNGYYRGLVEALEVDLNRRIEDLSTGNRKKVAVIQSLLHRPRLLILDEPTSGLDPLMQHRFFDILREANREGTTIFFSSHILSEVEKLCHRVAIIKQGRLAEEADVADLKKRMLTRVDIRLTREVPGLKLTTPGILSFNGHDHSYSFLFQGEIKPLVVELAGLPLDQLYIAEPDLEEVFMHYYKESGNQEEVK